MAENSESKVSVFADILSSPRQIVRLGRDESSGERGLTQKQRPERESSGLFVNLGASADHDSPVDAAASAKASASCSSGVSSIVTGL